ncbi:MAG: hypothetical protein WDN76_02380 [Alphaproteobacteria bacterium]
MTGSLFVPASFTPANSARAAALRVVRPNASSICWVNTGGVVECFLAMPLT